MTRSDHEAPVEVAGGRNVTISTRDARRAVRFYHRAFGLEIVSETRSEGRQRVLMRGRGCVYVAIDEQHDAAPVKKRVRFHAIDLDGARERLWNLGVAVTDGCVEPRFDPGRPCRSLRMRDPDGNEIELAEQVALIGLLEQCGNAWLARGHQVIA